MMRSENIEVGSVDITLSGTLTGPDSGSNRLVICVHGSGQMDRDQNSLGQALNIFNALAKDFAESGASTYRYDKRGVGKSSGDYWRCGISELVADVQNVIRHFRETGTYDEIYLLGHSEGALIATMASLEVSVDGLILICPFVTPMRDILQAQAREVNRHIKGLRGVQGFATRGAYYLIGGAESQQKKLIEHVNATDAPYFRHRLQRVNAKWLREHLALDSLAQYKNISVPTLIIRADSDAQSSPTDANEIAELLGNHAKLVAFPRMSHLLRETDEPGFSDYTAQMTRPMSAAIYETVIDWIWAQHDD